MTRIAQAAAALAAAVLLLAALAVGHRRKPAWDADLDREQ